MGLEEKRTDWDSVLKHVVRDGILGKRHVLCDWWEARHIVALYEVTQKGNIFAGATEFVDWFSEIFHGAFGGTKCPGNLVKTVEKVIN